MNRGKAIDRARETLRAAGPKGAWVREVTPQQGGLRRHGVELLVRAGEAEWVVEGLHARLLVKEPEGTVHRWAPLSTIDDYVALGWLPHPMTLIDSPHGPYRMHVEWRCCCGRAVTEPAQVQIIRRTIFDTTA